MDNDISDVTDEWSLYVTSINLSTSFGHMETKISYKGQGQNVVPLCNLKFSIIKMNDLWGIHNEESICHGL